MCCVCVCVCWGDGDKSQREVSARIHWHVVIPIPTLLHVFRSTLLLCQGFILYLVPLGKGFDLTGDEVAVAVVVGVFREIGTFHRCVLHESPRDSSVIIGERGLLPVAREVGARGRGRPCHFVRCPWRHSRAHRSGRGGRGEEDEKEEQEGSGSACCPSAACSTGASEVGCRRREGHV